MIMSIIPIFLYELGVTVVYVFIEGGISFKYVHKVAWSQDLAALVWFLTGFLFLYHFYKLFCYEDVSKIDVPRYERPKHEKYTGSKDTDY